MKTQVLSFQQFLGTMNFIHELLPPILNVQYQHSTSTIETKVAAYQATFENFIAVKNAVPKKFCLIYRISNLYFVSICIIIFRQNLNYERNIFSSVG